MKLVEFSRDWADEFTAIGFAVMEDSRWESFQSTMKGTKSYSFNFGTNEGWEDESGAEFITDYKATDITVDEGQLLINLFNLTKAFDQDYFDFGIFPDDRDWNDDEEV